MRKFWPLLMIVCFGVFDAASTFYLYWQLGTFEYELGLLPNILYSFGDIEAVIVFKLMLTTIAAILMYYIALNVPRLDNMCKLMCIGASLVGIFAATSNMAGALTGSTLWIFGIRGDMIAYLLFTVFFVMGIVDLVLKGQKNDPAGNLNKKPP